MAACVLENNLLICIVIKKYLPYNSTGTAPPPALGSEIPLNQGGLFLMIIFDDSLCFKISKGGPLIIFPSEVQNPKMEGKYTMF